MNSAQAVESFDEHIVPSDVVDHLCFIDQGNVLMCKGDVCHVVYRLEFHEKVDGAGGELYQLSIDSPQDFPVSLFSVVKHEPAGVALLGRIVSPPFVALLVANRAGLDQERFKAGDRRPALFYRKIM